MNHVDFGTDSVRRNMLAVTGPLLVAQLLNLLYNIIDRIYIGRIPGVGTTALAGVGLCFPVITMITAFANMFGTGGSPLFSIERGKKDDEGAVKIMSNAYFMLILTGIILTVAGFLFHRPILYLFGASDATIEYGSEYLTIYLVGTIFVMTTLGLNPYINAQGFARTGMLIVVLGAGINIALDPVFIFAFGLGVRGAAIATVISQFASAVWVLKFITGKKADIALHFRGFKPDPRCIRQITALGLSSFTMMFTNSLVQIVCNATLSAWGGDIYVSAMTVLNSIRQIADVPALSLCEGTTPVMSYNFGAGKTDNLKRTIRFFSQLEIVYMVLIWAAIAAFPVLFIGIFNSDASLIEVAEPALQIYFFGYVMMAFQHMGQTVFKSLNYAKHAIFFSLFRKVIIVVPLTILLPHIARIGVMGVFIAEPVSNFIGGLSCYITMRFKVMRRLKRGEKLLTETKEAA